MGAYTTIAIEKEQYKAIIYVLRAGYTYNGIMHRPAPQTAAALVVQANTGLRIGDILRLRLSDIVKDGDIFRLAITEGKTGKKRSFVVPDAVYNFIADYCAKNQIPNTRRIFPVSTRAIQKSLKNAAEYCKIDYTSTHSFRKFAACNIYEQSGYNIELTRQFLQHGSVTTTQTYLHRAPKQLETAIIKSTCIL